MGGEAAKERRRLKRLAAAQKDDTAESAPAVVKTNVKEGGQDNIAQLRLQRKIARKAKGTFKPLEGQSPPQIRKRKLESSNRTPVKKFKGGNNHASSTKTQRNNSVTKRSNEGKGKPPATKKTKPKKPKHLKRKIEHLTKAISSGGSGEGTESTVAQLEQQMQELAKQMEEFKKMKSDKSKSSNKATIITDETTKVTQSKGPDADNISDAERVLSEEENETKCAQSSSAVGEDSSDDDEDGVVEQVNTRSRGKRRRGRRESNNNKDGDDVEEDKMTADPTRQTAEKDSEKNTSTVESAKISVEENKSSTAPPVADDEAKQLKKTSKKDDKRRCIGRKPVTDFEVNKTYNGKVQYIKPRLGAFIDIGCHSDAFIHISCISDSYISSVEEVLKVGDEVKNARVVEIDREKKRITLSLRSEDHDAVKSQKGEVVTDVAEEPVEQKKEKVPLNTELNETLPVARSFNNNALSSGQKTGADLKRERKLARRAARRAMEQNEA